MDINSDGVEDILLGLDATYMVYFTGSDGGDSVPLLSNEGFLYSQTQIIDLYLPSPVLMDYNGDGVKDLFCGTGSGKICVFINNGTPEVHSFQDEYIQLEDENGVIDLGSTSVLDCCDLDGDGLEDLIAGYVQGCNGYVCWLKNNGPDAPFRFQPPEQLCYSPGGAPIVHSEAVYPSAGDLNSDGVPELLVGEYYGETFVYWGSCTGVLEESNLNVCGVSPPVVLSNPVSGLLTVETATAGVLSVYDCSGRLAATHSVQEPGISSMNVTHLSSGVYTVVITGESVSRAARFTLLE